MPIDIIKKIINDHLDNKQNIDGDNQYYWRNKLSKIDSVSAKGIIEKIDKNQTNKNSRALNNVLQVVQYIIETLIKDDKTTAGDDQALNQNLFYEQKHYQNNHYINTADINHKSHPLAEMNSPEIQEIINMASSVLAETDGNVGLAQEILKTTGLEKMQSLDRTKLDSLAATLKAISASPTNQNTDGNTR